MNNQIWITDEDEELKLRIKILVHGGLGSLQGRNPAKTKVKAEFIWRDLKRDFQGFVQQCVNYITTRNEERILEPTPNSMQKIRTI